MKIEESNSTLTNLYNSHNDQVISIENNEYIQLFEKFNDLVSNIEDE